MKRASEARASARSRYSCRYTSSYFRVFIHDSQPPFSQGLDRKSTRLNSSHLGISYAVFCLNDTATTEIYTLSLHDALPISDRGTLADTPLRISGSSSTTRSRHFPRD